jgi:hypothetical protein
LASKDGFKVFGQQTHVSSSRARRVHEIQKKKEKKEGIERRNNKQQYI